jgi:hypothetical protein
MTLKFKKEKKHKNLKQVCNADLVVKLDSGCDETPVLGSYYCQKHCSRVHQKDKYDGNINLF